MKQHIISNGSRFTLDEAEAVTLIIKDGKGTTLTYEADTPYGVRLESIGSDRNIHLSFVVANMKIKEKKK